MSKLIRKFSEFLLFFFEKSNFNSIKKINLILKEDSIQHEC